MKSVKNGKRSRQKKQGRRPRFWFSLLCGMLIASFCYSAYKVADELIASKTIKEQEQILRILKELDMYKNN